MTVTTSQYTENSYRVNISNEVTYTNILSGMNTAITSLGWSLYDSLDNNVPGTGTTSIYSPIFTRVYRALNDDATTYKYFIIRYNIIKMCLWTGTCEDWNLNTHISVNESWNNAGSFVQNYDIKSSFIWVMATGKHIVIWPWILGEPGLWTGVFEFQRIAPEDIIAKSAPCWAWTNSIMIGTPWGQNSTGTSKVMFAFPRTPDGLTGSAAAAAFAPVINRMMYPPSHPSGTIAISSSTLMGHLAGSYYAANPWSSSPRSYFNDLDKPIFYPISVNGIDKEMPFGNMYDVSYGKPIGTGGDIVSLPLDNTSGIINSSGTPSSTISLPLNGMYNSASNGYGQGTSYNSITDFLDGTSGQSYSIYCTNFGADTICVIGKHLYYTVANATNGNAGIYRLDTLDMFKSRGSKTSAYYLNLTPASSTWNYGQKIYTSRNNLGVFDLIFDGQKTLYGSTTTGVLKIDTETLAATELTLVGSGTGLTVTTTASGGVITAATLSAAGSGYLNGGTGTLRFIISGGTFPSLCSISVTAGVPSGAITVLTIGSYSQGGNGYTTSATPVSTTPISTAARGYLSLDMQYLYATTTPLADVNTTKPEAVSINLSTFTQTALYPTSRNIGATSKVGKAHSTYNGQCVLFTTNNDTAWFGRGAYYDIFTPDTSTFVSGNTLSSQIAGMYAPMLFYYDNTSGRFFVIDINITSTGDSYISTLAAMRSREISGANLVNSVLMGSSASAVPASPGYCFQTYSSQSNCSELEYMFKYGILYFWVKATYSVGAKPCAAIMLSNPASSGAPSMLYLNNVNSFSPSGNTIFGGGADKIISHGARNYVKLNTDSSSTSSCIIVQFNNYNDFWQEPTTGINSVANSDSQNKFIFSTGRLYLKA